MSPFPGAGGRGQGHSEGARTTVLFLNAVVSCYDVQFPDAPGFCLGIPCTERRLRGQAVWRVGLKAELGFHLSF